MGQLPLIPVDKPSVYEGVQVSYGIAPILNTLSVLATKPNRPQWSLYLVNVETIIRDRKEAFIDPDTAAAAVITDMKVLAQYIAAYTRLDPTAKLRKHPPVICFYLPHYENIPKMFLREKLPAGTENRHKIRDKIEQMMRTNGFPTTYEDVNIIIAVVGEKLWPHKDLIKDLSKIIDGLLFRKTLMISHVPSDFHLYRQFQDFSILESFTGALKNSKQFGKKVFGDESLPFNKYLHLLLGDKWYLKSLIKPAVKAEIKKRALAEHWSIIPDKAVLLSLSTFIPLPADMYIKPEI